LCPGKLIIQLSLSQTGGKIAADLRILHSHGLEVDESTLTGESYFQISEKLRFSCFQPQWVRSSSL